MIPGWKDILAVQGHYDDLLREAEAERLARSAQSIPERRRLAVSRLLAWIGRRLETWGNRLQEPARLSSDMVDCCAADC